LYVFFLFAFFALPIGINIYSISRKLRTYFV